MYSVTEKPNERYPSPVVPAYANFELAKRMHSDNLDHQPLPDCVADLALRKSQINNFHSIASVTKGVGIKMYNAGPTHCTKVKVFRPKESSVSPKNCVSGIFGNNYLKKNTKQMSAMDLAIGWDYKTEYLLDEPQSPVHIDGSNGSSGPAVFTYIKPAGKQNESILARGQSDGLFINTLGKPGLFDKDIMRRKNNLVDGHNDQEESCVCDTDIKHSSVCNTPLKDRAHNSDFKQLLAPKFACCNTVLPKNPFGERYQSSPNLFIADKQYKALRSKYFEDDNKTSNKDFVIGTRCKRESNFRPSCIRYNNKVVPSSKCYSTTSFNAYLPNKTVFRASVPINSRSKITTNSYTSQNNRILVVPRPCNPYSTKNYDIDTLVPPFQSIHGGSGQTGYPEHWRLSSVYQHAYKPIDQRRKPLLHTVFK